MQSQEKKSQQQTQQHANVIEEDKADDEHLFMTSQTCNSHELNTWLIDKGCTSHMTKHLSIFTSIDISGQPEVKLGNGEVVQAKGKGRVTVSRKRGTKLIINVLYIPELNQNLLSVAQMLSNGNSFYLKLDLVEGHVFSAKIDESVV